MRLIDADALYETLVTGDIRETQQFCYPCKKVLEAIDAQPTVEAISKEVALDALTDDLSYYGSGAAEAVGMARAMGIIERLPGGEKTQLSEESTTTLQQTCNLATDCISRQAAIDALGERPMVWTGSDYEIAQRNQYDMDKLAIETVPSAQPEIIRCSECKYMMPDGRCLEFADDNIRPSASDFCSAGTRK